MKNILFIAICCTLLIFFPKCSNPEKEQLQIICDELNIKNSYLEKKNELASTLLKTYSFGQETSSLIFQIQNEFSILKENQNYDFSNLEVLINLITEFKNKNITNLPSPSQFIEEIDDLLKNVSQLQNSTVICQSYSMNNLLQLENDFYGILLIEINSSTFYTFNKIEIISISRNNMLQENDTLELKVGISAYDSNSRSNIKYWLDDSTKNESNMIELSIPYFQKIPIVASKGNHTIYGNIEVIEKGKSSWKPWEYKFTVK